MIATASDPVFASKKLRQKWPDVIVLDIEMPRMDGISFLRKIMTERPTPVIIRLSLAENGAQATFDAMAAGAVSIITKPKAGLKSFLLDASNDIVQAVRTAVTPTCAPYPEETPWPPRLISTTEPSADVLFSRYGTDRNGAHHRPVDRHRHLNRRHTGA